MTSLNLHLACILTVVVLVTSTSCQFVESLVEVKKNFLLKGHVIRSQQTTSQLSCAHLCVRKEGCESFNYKLLSNTKGVCELSSTIAGRFDGCLTKGAGWVYGQIVRFGNKSFENSAEPGKIRKITQGFS